MIAGTLGVLDPVDEPLESWKHPADYPAIQVTTSQATHEDMVAQAGRAATQVKESAQDVTVGTDQNGSVYVDTGREDHIEPFATNWVADVTGSGVVLAESVDDANAEFPFPFDVVSAQAGSEVERQALDISDLHRSWDQDGTLGDVWMSGSDATAGTNIAYHGAADSADAPPTIGLGFKRPWGGTVVRGVVYESGYVALYSEDVPSKALQFVAEELLPYTRDWNPEEHADQTDFDDFGEGA